MNTKINYSIEVKKVDKQRILSVYSDFYKRKYQKLLDKKLTDRTIKSNALGFIFFNLFLFLAVALVIKDLVLLLIIETVIILPISILVYSKVIKSESQINTDKKILTFLHNKTKLGLKRIESGIINKLDKQAPFTYNYTITDSTIEIKLINSTKQDVFIRKWEIIKSAFITEQDVIFVPRSNLKAVFRIELPEDPTVKEELVRFIQSKVNEF